MRILLLFLCIMVSVYGFYIYKKTKDIFNPISMFGWPILIGYIVFLVNYDDSSIKTVSLFIYFIGIISFMIGFLLQRGIYQYPLAYNNEIKNNELTIYKDSLNIIKIISLVGIVATFFYVVKTAYAGPFGTNIIRNLRYIGNYENTRGFVSTYGIVAVKVFLYVIFYQIFVSGNKENKKWIPVLVFGILFGLLATIARTELIEVSIALYYLYSLKNKVYHNKISMIKKMKERWRAFILLSLIVSAFIFIAIRTEKLGNDSVLDKDFFIFRYAGLEIKNFNSYILGNSFSTKGYHSFGILGKLLCGANLGPNNDLFLFVAKEYHGPVCSFIAAPYADFGIIGVIITMFIQGFFHGYIYMKTLRKGGYWSIFYTTCIYSDLMAFYAFQYMMSSQVYVLLLIVFLHNAKFKKTMVIKPRNKVNK